MSSAPDDVPVVSAEHRRRRRDAYERASAAHQRAATVHEDAAEFFDLRGDIERAAWHRRAAGEEHRRARDAQDVADTQ